MWSLHWPLTASLNHSAVFWQPLWVLFLFDPNCFLLGWSLSSEPLGSMGPPSTHNLVPDLGLLPPSLLTDCDLFSPLVPTSQRCLVRALLVYGVHEGIWVLFRSIWNVLLRYLDIILSETWVDWTEPTLLSLMSQILALTLLRIQGFVLSGHEYTGILFPRLKYRA